MGWHLTLAPYHLINTALNIEASKYANRRGRNADFFILGPLFTGSASTNYVDTELMEKNSPELNGRNGDGDFRRGGVPLFPHCLQETLCSPRPGDAHHTDYQAAFNRERRLSPSCARFARPPKLLA